MQTLNDYIGPGLDILSIGLNPSPPSVAAGIYFAGKRNRFWRALNASGLIDENLEASSKSMQRLFLHYRIGFTDTVKRPTPGAKDLRRADFIRDVPRLEQKLLYYKPMIAWFHGKVAYRHFLSVLEIEQSTVRWGEQMKTIGESKIFVSPNPSPANAAFSLEDLIDYYTTLNRLRNSILIL